MSIGFYDTTKLWVVVIVSLLVFVSADTTTANHRALLALDKVMSGPLVAGMNVTIEYTIHNVGGRVATDISLRDLSFPASRFNADKAARHSWPRLEPGQSLSHALKVEPKRAGEIYVAPAAVTYMDDDERRVSRLAADDSVVVETLISFRRRTDRHINTWLVYFFAFLLLSVAPFGYSEIKVRSLLGSPATNKKS